MTKRTQGHIEFRMRHSRNPKSEIRLSWYRIMSMNKARISARLLSIFLVIAALGSAAAQTPEQVSEKRLRWWREARFGMFIHWGLYAVPAGEWKGQPIAGLGEWIMNRAKIPGAAYKELAN